MTKKRIPALSGLDRQLRFTTAKLVTIDGLEDEALEIDRLSFGTIMPLVKIVEVSVESDANRNASGDFAPPFPPPKAESPVHLLSLDGAHKRRHVSQESFRASEMRNRQIYSRCRVISY